MLKLNMDTLTHAVYITPFVQRPQPAGKIDTLFSWRKHEYEILQLHTVIHAITKKFSDLICVIQRKRFNKLYIMTVCNNHMTRSNFLTFFNYLIDSDPEYCEMQNKHSSVLNKFKSNEM